MHIAMAVYYLFASALAPAFIQEYLWWVCHVWGLRDGCQAGRVMVNETDQAVI